MVSTDELKARVTEFFRFDKREIVEISASMLVMGFIFSFNDWHPTQLVVGIQHFLLSIIAVGLSLGFRIGCQKIYALSEGYKAEFKVWWLGLFISFLIVFITTLLTSKALPIALVGTVATTFMVKQRLGEFRYGHGYGDSAFIGLWGILGSLLAAIFFAILLHFSPDNYFFNQGLLFNVVFAFSALIPLPQLDGLIILFGSKFLYYAGLIAAILAAVLLIPKTTFGLVLAIIIAVAVTIWLLLTMSEK